MDRKKTVILVGQLPPPIHGQSVAIERIAGIRSERFDNLGVNTNMQFGPVQLITMTDNLLSALRPQDTNSANVRVGLNLVFK